jgi:hypothetical protein
LSAVLTVAAWPGAAFAYVGPPAALGTLSAIFGILITILSTAFYLALRATRGLWQRIVDSAIRRPSSRPAE